MNMYNENANAARQTAESENQEKEEKKREREGIEVPVGIELLNRGFMNLQHGGFGKKLRDHVSKHLLKKALPREFIKKHGIDGLLDAYQKAGGGKAGIKAAIAHAASKAPIDLDKVHAAVGGKENYDLMKGILASGGSKQDVIDALGDGVGDAAEKHLATIVEKGRGAAAAASSSAGAAASAVIKRGQQSAAVVTRRTKQVVNDTTAAMSNAAQQAKNKGLSIKQQAEAKGLSVRDMANAERDRKIANVQREFAAKRAAVIESANTAAEKARVTKQALVDRGEGARKDIEGNVAARVAATKRAATSEIDSAGRIVQTAADGARSITTASKISEPVRQSLTRVARGAASVVAAPAVLAARGVKAVVAKTRAVAAGAATSMRSASVTKTEGDESWANLQKSKGKIPIKTSIPEEAALRRDLDGDLTRLPSIGLAAPRTKAVRAAERFKTPERGSLGRASSVVPATKEKYEDWVKRNQKTFHGVNERIQASQRARPVQEESIATPDVREIPAVAVTESRTAPMIRPVAPPVPQETLRATARAAPAPVAAPVAPAPVAPVAARVVPNRPMTRREQINADRDRTIATIKARSIAPVRQIRPDLPDINNLGKGFAPRSSSLFSGVEVKPTTQQRVMRGKVPGKPVYTPPTTAEVRGAAQQRIRSRRRPLNFDDDAINQIAGKRTTPQITEQGDATPSFLKSPAEIKEAQDWERGSSASTGEFSTRLVRSTTEQAAPAPKSAFRRTAGLFDTPSVKPSSGIRITKPMLKKSMSKSLAPLPSNAVQRSSAVQDFTGMNQAVANQKTAFREQQSTRVISGAQAPAALQPSGGYVEPTTQTAFADEFSAAQRLQPSVSEYTPSRGLSFEPEEE
jgi:hypothetical protein